MVTCVYNRADLLERTLYFMQKQTHKYEWEIIIIDDGSGDNIKSVFDEYKRKLPIRMFSTNRDWYCNVAYAANCGVKIAKGEYILYSSPEVIHYGNTFDTLHEILEAGDYLVASTRMMYKIDHDAYLAIQSGVLIVIIRVLKISASH